MLLDLRSPGRGWAHIRVPGGTVKYLVRGATFTTETDPTDRTHVCVWVQVRTYGSKHWRGAPPKVGVRKLLEKTYPWDISDQAVRDAMVVLGLAPAGTDMPLCHYYALLVDQADAHLIEWSEAASTLHEYEMAEKRALPKQPTPDGIVRYRVDWSKTREYNDIIHLELSVQVKPTPTLVGVRVFRI
jgi:hypothetical protein